MRDYIALGCDIAAKHDRLLAQCVDRLPGGRGWRLHDLFLDIVEAFVQIGQHRFHAFEQARGQHGDEVR